MSSVQSAFDLNHDGFSDFIAITTSCCSVTTVQIAFGSAGGAGPGASISINGGSASNGAGDVNGDGFSDLIVGLWQATGGGAAYLYLGASGGPGASPSTMLVPPATTNSFGTSVASAASFSGRLARGLAPGALRFIRGS